MFKGANIKLLNLGKNQLDSIKAEIFSESIISKVILENNGLTSLDKCSLNTLLNATELYFGYNKISSISTDLFCSNTSKIQILYLNMNRIQDLGFLASNQFSSLKTLNIESNLIQSLKSTDLNGLSKLENLIIGNNYLNFIEAGFFQMLNLKQLNLSNINLVGFKNISLEQFPEKIEYLDLSFNTLGSFIVNKERPNVKNISLRRTNLTSLDGFNFECLKNLQSLDLSENILGDFPLIKWSALSNLNALFLSNMNLSNLDPLRQFSADSSLKFLNLSNNLISSSLLALNKLSSLKTVDLSNNKLEFIEKEAFINLNIFYLYLQNNRLKSLPYLRQSSLLINIKCNFIRIIDTNLDIKMSKLVALDLRENLVKELKFGYIFDQNIQLQELYLSRNSLKSINENDFSYFLMLVILDLESNGIEEIEEGAFASMDRLEVLNLGNNNLTYLHEGTFINQLQLMDLNLSFNRLEYIKSEIFANLYNLVNLDLSNNRLKTIDDYSFKSFSLLENVKIDGNPKLALFNYSLQGLDSIKTIFISFDALISSNNTICLLDNLKPAKLKEVGDLVYYRSISVIYNDEKRFDCELVLKFIKYNVQVNLRDDNQFLIFTSNCLNILLV